MAFLVIHYPIYHDLVGDILDYTLLNDATHTM